MHYLFFDTETTGLPKDYKQSYTNTDNWPRLVQIAWILSDEKGNIIEKKDYIIKPDGWTINKSASNIHRITTKQAKKEGVPINDVLEEFYPFFLNDNITLVGHNVKFDFNIIASEFIRSEYKDIFKRKKQICTMMESTDFCKIKVKWGYKWPKLQELHNKLFEIDFEEAHNAAADIEATVRCFYELQKLNVIKQ